MKTKFTSILKLTTECFLSQETQSLNIYRFSQKENKSDFKKQSLNTFSPNVSQDY